MFQKTSYLDMHQISGKLAMIFVDGDDRGGDDDDDDDDDHHHHQQQ